MLTYVAHNLHTSVLNIPHVHPELAIDLARDITIEEFTTAARAM